jgi:G6PDH family F420-dependent oxidoreductase
VHYSGDYFEVPEARLWDRPENGVPVGVAVSGPQSCQLAAEYADALIAIEPRPELIEQFDAAGGVDGPRYAQVAVCYGPDEAECRRLAYDQFRWFGLGWPVMAELPNHRSFERASAAVTEQQVAETIPCGPNLDRHVAAVRRFVDAGFTHVALVQVGATLQGRFLDFCEKELLPAARSLARAA